MKNSRRFHKKTIILLASGSLCMSAALIARHFLAENTGDFMRGLGVSLMIGSIFIEGRLRRKS